MHGHAGHDHSSETADLSDRRLVIAIALNLGLSLVELIAGLFSGSLSLIADATHNFNDCMSIVIALVARIVGRRAPDHRRTFGYRRAEIVGAFINLILLIVVGIFLIYEAIERFFQPQEILGWWMVGAAAFALFVDVITVIFLWQSSRGNLNLRATMLHHLSDAIASVGVMIGGTIIALSGWMFVDLIITLVIATYILWQSFALLKPTIAILMDSVPLDIEINELAEKLTRIEHVVEVHHLHVRELDEERRAAEVHIVVSDDDIGFMERIKGEVRTLLHHDYQVAHSTLEFETISETCGLTSCGPQHEAEAEPCHHHDHG